MHVGIVGRGRMGTALEHALREAGADVLMLRGRGRGPDGLAQAASPPLDVVLLAVPDAAIAETAARIAPGPLVGHLSGATTLAPLAPHEAFSLHPLLSATGAGTRFAGAWAAIDGASDRVLAAAGELAALLGLRTFRVSDEDRAAYHASASMAANFLVALEGAAERLAATAGVPREALAPLARGALENWERLGAAHALTGPVARGDAATIERQRTAVAERMPASLPLYDAMVAASRDLVARRNDPPTPDAAGGRPWRRGDDMRIVRTVRELRECVREARAGGSSRIGLVPTMGALHEGHLSLVRAAQREADFVVMSIFVNPKQFTEASDLDAYPRQEEADAALAESAGVDLIFAPDAAELYPDGFVTNVHVGGPLTETLEAAGRGPEHFDGVATVVSKLLIAVAPDSAYFGQKDAQQLLVVRRMVTDLGLPVDIVSCPTVRDADGLAKSSRNVRLNAEDRSQAVAIPRALEAAEAALALGETRTAALHSRAAAVLSAAGVAPEYLAFVDTHELAPVDVIDRPVLLAVAARVGGVRLIDNALLSPPAADGRPDPEEK